MRQGWGNDHSPPRHGRSPPPRSPPPRSPSPVNHTRSRLRDDRDPSQSLLGPPPNATSTGTSVGGWEIPNSLRRAAIPSSEEPHGSSVAQGQTGSSGQPPPALTLADESLAPIYDPPRAPALMPALLSGSWSAAASQVLGGRAVADESMLLGPRSMIDPKQAVSSKPLHRSSHEGSLILMEEDSLGSGAALRQAVSNLAIEVSDFAGTQGGMRMGYNASTHAGVETLMRARSPQLIFSKDGRASSCGACAHDSRPLFRNWKPV